MSLVVPHVSQINLAIHRARARRVPQPMSRRLAQSFGCAFTRFACRLQMVDRIVEHLLDDQMHTTAAQCPVGASDRQQQRCRFTAIGQGSQGAAETVSAKQAKA